MSERDLFIAAVQITDPAERAAWLDQQCGGEATLRQRLAVLLQAHDQAGSLLDNPVVAPPATTGFEGQGAPAPEAGEEPLREGPGTVIGPYKLLEQIGEGGFGVVFLAEQTQPVRRKVALKVLKPGMDTRQVVARFEAERQALTIMDHPHIAKVFDGGATPSGRPYFVMELVKGVPITAFCDQHQLTPRQRLELFVPVCQAVQHAHQKGIIHRDLKPSNVLVSRHDTTPMVKVIDFGVAKALGQQLTDKTLFTGIAQMIGTPLYMSPEQAGMSDLDVDTRSDLYSLGVLLYELLTGTTPFTKERFKQAAYDEIRRIIREEEPPKPSTRLSESKESLPSISAQRQTEPAKLTKLVRGELDWIVMKALEKDRNRRYETANGFALDVQRYLADEPVLAGPPSAWYRFRKFARRNRAQLALAAALGLLLLGAGAFAWHTDRQAAQRRADADRRAALTEREVTAALAELATLLDRGGQEIQNPPRWRLTLDAARSAHRRAGAALETGPASDELRGQVQAVGDQLAGDEADCETAGRCEGWVGHLLAGYGRPDLPIAELRRRAEGLLDRAGVPPAATPPGSRAAAVRGHRLRYPLTALVLMADLVNKSLGGQERGPLGALAGELAKDVHPLQGAVRAAGGGTLRAVLADGLGRSATSTELVCLAFCLVVDPAADRTGVEVLLDEALRRNPADLAAMTLHLGRRSGGTFLRVDPRTGITWISPPDRRPPVLPEPELRTLAAAERGLTLRPDLAFLWVFSADSLRAGGHYGWAADQYRQAVRLNPADQPSHVRLAEALVNAGRVGEAVEVYRATLRAFPRLLVTTTSPFAEVGTVGTAVRVAAARAALVLAHDAGEATARLGAAERRELRRDALRWLREWLTESPPTGLDLFLVKRDPAFRPVRDPAARDQLPPDERAEWRDLWEAVHSARGTGHQRYAFVGDPVEPSPPDPPEVAPPREVKP